MKSFDYSTYELIRRRAAYPLLQRFGINRYELWMLCQMCGYIQYKGRVIVGKQRFFSFVTGNAREKAKMMGYYTGLSKKGFIGLFEYIKRPGSESFGISDLGARVLGEYEGELDKMFLLLQNDSRLDNDPAEWLHMDSIGSYYRKSA